MRALLLCSLLVGCSPGEGTLSDPTELSDASDAAASDAGDEAGDDADTSGTDAGSDATTDTPIVSDVGVDGFIADTAPDAPPPPSCPALAACPSTPAGLTEGGGPRPIERCAFVLDDDGKGPAYETAIAGLAAALKKVSVADVLGDLNRTATSIGASTLPGVPGFQRGFSWDADDEGKEWWIPQGLTGSADASAAGTVAGKKVVAVSWYYDATKHPGSTGEKGIRLSFADVTSTKVTYRHALLVLPKMAAGRADFDPIDIHAGGIAWVGDRLWVADTGRGLRVFDLSRMFQVATDKDSVGWDGAAYQGGLYKYVIPQIGAWADGSKCAPVFSFVALDRTATPPALVTGEYSATAIDGRVFQFPIDLATGALAAKTWATGAWSMGQRQVQGAVTHGGAFYFSSSAPAAGKGVLYGAREGKKTLSYPWADAPEDLLFDTKANTLWGASEGLGRRWVFAVDATALKTP